MKNLIMFSSVIYDNKEIEDKIKEMSRGNKLTIIPADMQFCGDGLDSNEFYYKKIGFNVSKFDVGYLYDAEKVDELLTSDVIHLGGGNTFLFSWLLHQRKLIEPLKQWVEQGGLLIGNSAGSIIMEETIDIALIADTDIIRDENNPEYYQGLGFVPYWIKPHYEMWSKHVDFQELADLFDKTIVCLNEDQCIIVQNDEVIFYNDPSVFVPVKN